jgi:AraC-like DNA-binding protein
MPASVKHLFFQILTAVLLSCLTLQAAEQGRNFYALSKQNGLSDNCVLQLQQLTDGRMVVVTQRAIDIYDGQQFNSVPIDTTMWMPLPAYNGATHLFSDSNDRLWMKQWGRLFCFDLPTMRQTTVKDWSNDDFFIDSRNEVWLLSGRQLKGQRSGIVLQLPEEAGALQDVVAFRKGIYTFFDSGTVVVFDEHGKIAFQSYAYDKDLAKEYMWTSLVVCGFDECHLYQVRTGSGGSVLLSFDSFRQQWKQLLTSPKFMHTLTATPSGILYLTTPDGYLRINPATNQQEAHRELQLPDGTTLSTGINTVCLDREGGIWLGTYNNGLLYTSPLSGLFDTQPIDIEVYPILTSIYLHGQPLRVGAEYNGQCLLNVTPPYADHLTFRHDQNSLAFQFSTMNYVRPRSTFYRYRFSGDDKRWHTLSADSVGGMVDDKGVLYLPLVGLSPGDYTLEVMATTHPDHWNEAALRTIHFTIQHPWWLSAKAFACYSLLLFALIGMLFLLYRRRMQRKNREALLLLRIQNLVEQVNQYENTAAMVVLSEPTLPQKAETEPEPTQQEKEFMARATRLVEQHLSTPQYGVEQLAADLCMERTGLYKKLTALMQQSPVVFIRSIRLHRAAEMLLQGELSIADVAARTGFSSTSYFSKCFQKEFGCKPSDYVEK